MIRMSVKTHSAMDSAGKKRDVEENADERGGGRTPGKNCSSCVIDDWVTTVHSKRLDCAEGGKKGTGHKITGDVPKGGRRRRKKFSTIKVARYQRARGIQGKKKFLKR